MQQFFINLQKKYFTGQQPFLWFLFFLTIILTLSPFFRIEFTTADDVEFFMSAMAGKTDALEYARGAGRFYFLITKPLYHVAYVVDNFYFTKIIQYGFLLLSFVLFAMVVNKVFKLKEFTLLIFLLLFVFLTVTPNYFIPIIAYPFFFTCSFSIFLFSLLRLIKYEETKKYKYLIQSAMLFSIALLFYETYLIFLLFIVGFLFVKNIAEQGKNAFTKKSFYKKIVPFLLVGLAYICVYFAYRKSVGTSEFYHGSSFAKDFSISNFLKIIWNYNRAALPTYVFNRCQEVIETSSILATGHRNNFWYMLVHSPIALILNASLQCFLCVYLLLRMKPHISWRKIGLGFLIAFIFIFAVHGLLGISDKYNSIYYFFSGYVTTFFSYFGITLMIGIIGYACLKLCHKIKWLKGFLISVFTLLIFYVAIIIGYSNEHLSKDWQRSQNRFKIVDKTLQKGIFSEIPENTLIYAADLSETSSLLGKGVCGQAFSWKQYIYQRIGKQLNVHVEMEKFTEAALANPKQDIYYIAKYENPKNLDVLLVLSKVNDSSMNWKDEANMFTKATTNEAKVYYYSPSKDFIFELHIPEQNQPSTILINGVKHESHSGFNVVKINNENNKEEITSFSIKSDKPFSVKDFLVSNIGFVNTENHLID